MKPTNRQTDKPTSTGKCNFKHGIDSFFTWQQYLLASPI